MAENQLDRLFQTADIEPNYFGSSLIESYILIYMF